MVATNGGPHGAALSTVRDLSLMNIIGKYEHTAPCQNMIAEVSELVEKKHGKVGKEARLDCQGPRMWATLCDNHENGSSSVRQGSRFRHVLGSLSHG